MSRPFNELLNEAKNLVKDGVSEITLLGQNVNSYGRDITLKLRGQEPHEDDLLLAGEHWNAREKRSASPLFADLLREVGNIKGIRRIRYTSPHPKDMREDVMKAMAQTESVCEHLHFPVQSGSDRILRKMRRGYTAERYLSKLLQARAIIPDLAVTTDIIVGFPGETNKDFEDTLELAATAQFDSAFTFIFSPRPGTEAAEMHEKFCNKEEVQDRYSRLREVIQRSGLIKHQERIGKEEEVIVEGPSKKNNKLTTGRTRQNKVVHFPAMDLPVGTIAITRVEEATPNYLLGSLLEIVEKPRTKTRIPVVSG